MNNRWSALLLLFCIRSVMAFQFQTVAALSPFIELEYGVGLGAVGFLFGLYMAPGLLLAIPGSSLARRFGEKRIVIVSLWLMALGFGIMSLAPVWSVGVAGRVLAGTGGIMMNVIVTKMVADWFEGREIATAMSILIVSWPTGIALALIVLPAVAGTAGLPAAFSVGAVLAGVSALAFLIYQPAPAASVARSSKAMSRRTAMAAVWTGGTWGFQNAALAVVFGFGVALLVDRSIEVEVAGRVTSLTMVALAIFGPIGGFVADKTGRYTTLITLSLVLMAACLFAIVSGASSTWLFITFGLACGLGAGPIMSLPGRYLPAAERGAGMGIFFTVYYAAMLITPPIAGWASETTGLAEAAFVVGIVFCALTLISLAASRATRVVQAA